MTVQFTLTKREAEAVLDASLVAITGGLARSQALVLAEFKLRQAVHRAMSDAS